jgi:Holliday junction resolvase
VSSYTRGTYAEKRTAAQLRADGYYVTESRGSHGVADLMAAKPGQVLLVQVKTGEARLDGAWWNDLAAAAAAAGALAIVADWPKRGRLRLRQITGPHRPRSKAWPCAPFYTDELGEAQVRQLGSRDVVQGR